ncbi:MAG: transcription termination factor Rho, partial [Phycisphaerales bacterium]|nr:transcription termination factor Rho [Phycisphaerales bacterium]
MAKSTTAEPESTSEKSSPRRGRRPASEQEGGGGSSGGGDSGEQQRRPQQQESSSQQRREEGSSQQRQGSGNSGQGGERRSGSHDGGGGGGGSHYQGQGGDPYGNKRRKKKKKKRRPGQGGPGGGGGGGHYHGRSGIPSGVLPNDDDLQREAAELEQFATSKEYKDAAKKALHIADLQKMNIGDLHKFATKEGLEDFHQLPRQELIFEILKKRAAENPVMFGQGTLEIMPEGFGFLRSPEQSYIASPDDIYVAPAQIRSMGLRKGMIIEGAIRPPREGERFFALLRIDRVNNQDPKALRTLPIFEDLTPLHPFQRFVLETEPDVLETRIIDLVTPIGRGQRGLIVAPPRTGKTVILQKITQAISTNFPEVKIIVLLIDERPEEVTDFRRNTNDDVEVIASTFDEDSSRHVVVAEMVMEKARRYVEFGEHVVILLDSITRLARAYNAAQPHSGKIMSGGIDSNALNRPKKFFGSARAIEDGGSLTILGTALVDTGSKADEVIFEEFKGTGNA